MFGKKAAKEQQKLAQQQQAQATQFIQQANAPDPLAEAQRKSSLDFLNWENSPGKDVMTAPGMSPYLSLYQNARKQQEDTAMGNGVGQLGLSGSSPNLWAKLLRQSRDRAQQNAAGSLEDAFNRRHAEATGSVMPLATLSANKGLSLASLASGNSNDAWRRYLQASQNSGFLNSDLFKQLLAGGAAVASGGVSEGGRWAH